MVEKKIEVSFPGGMKVNADVEGIIVKTDQAVKNGGEGSAAEPYQMFLVSIATCAGVYALDFCNAREIPVQDMTLTMQCEFDPVAVRCGKMRLDLKLPQGFPQKYKKAIIRVMDLCSVKKNILDPPVFEITAN